MLRHALNLKNLEQEKDNAIFIDVRERGYFLIDHIKDAINITSAERISHIAQENPHKKIILYCHSGTTAESIVEDILENGIENVYFANVSFGAIAKSNIEIVYYSKE